MTAKKAHELISSMIIKANRDFKKKKIKCIVWAASALVEIEKNTTSVQMTSIELSDPKETYHVLATLHDLGDHVLRDRAKLNAPKDKDRKCKR